MRSSKARRALLLGLAGALAAGLGAWIVLQWLSPRTARPPPPAFTDVTEAAGIRFRHFSGARGRMLNPETFGPGAGWFDHDGDGKPDLLLVNGNTLEGEPDPRATSILYRNLGDGRFEDVTGRAGLALPFYAMGFVSADVDEDGDQDLLLYGLHRSIFFTNQGGGVFRDATAAAGLEGMRGWVCAAAFLDYDRDGRLDLFAGNYVGWTPASEEGKDCTFGTPRKKYCPVAAFPPSAPQLFRGRGDGTFEERTEAAGLAALRGKALGVVVEDYDRDGYPDIFVANDSVPNFLLHNLKDGTFEDRGLESGFALDPGGTAFAGMGIDSAWAPDEGPLLIAIGNFSGEPTTLHVQEGRDYFLERSMAAGIGRATLDRVTFGLLLQDFDLDGLLDLFLLNGHVFDVEELTRVPYCQKPQLFLGREGGLFEEARSGDPGSFLDRPLLGRSLAAADFDGDGDLDLAVTENQGPALLLRNDLPGPGRFVRIELQGTKSHRDALGSEVTVRLQGAAGRRSVLRTRKAVSSYLSQSERQLTFGLRPGETLLRAEVAWPSGLREAFSGIAPGKEALLLEGSGEALAAGGDGVSSLPPSRRPAAPANPVAARRRGMESIRAGRLTEAVEHLDEAARLDGEDLVSQRALLAALERLGRREEAEARLEEIVRRHPDPHLLLAGLAVPLREEGQPRLAARLFEEALRLDPRRLDARLGLGNLAFDRGAYEEALGHYRRVLELSPASLEALTNTGKIHAIRKEYRLAIPLLESALALRPDLAAALSTLGGILIEEGDLARAEELLLRALRTARARETLLSIHGNLGILHLRKRDPGKARSSFEKVLELDPGDRRARSALERLENQGREN